MLLDNLGYKILECTKFNLLLNTYMCVKIFTALALKICHP